MRKNMLNTTIDRFLNKDYRTAKAYHMAKLYYYDLLHSLTSRNEEKVIVYTMGKIGSTTVEKSLKALRKMPVYHIHVLTPDGIDRADKIYEESFERRRKIAFHVLESQYLRKQLDKGLKGKKWKVVTLVRDPIAKNVSSLFENLDLALDYKYEDKVKYLKTEDIIEELGEIFLKKFDNHDKPLTWLDLELKPVFGIDVFSSEFPRSKGYKIYEAENVDLLLLRLENLNQCACEAFKEFLDVSELNLIRANTGGNKDYGDIYRNFLDSVSLPDSYVNKMYTSKYMRHFYSQEEIEAFKAKWHKQNLLEVQ